MLWPGMERCAEVRIRNFGKERLMSVTARELVERLSGATGCKLDKTLDTIKWGDAERVVTGVAVTFMGTYEVLERAAARGLNFVISHEPIFWHHTDDKGRMAGDKVFGAKCALMERKGLVLWRFHDYPHAQRPDAILEGMTEALGWKGYQSRENAHLFELPETSLGELAGRLKAALGATVVRGVGRPEMRVRRVALSPGSPGTENHLRFLQRGDVEVLVTGESMEWETNEYVRDASAAGLGKGLVLVGHRNSEEAGMEFVARWVRAHVAEVPVEFVGAGDPFWLG